MITVVRKKPVQVKSRRMRRAQPIPLYNSSYSFPSNDFFDLRLPRIKMLEEPFLRKKGFRPVDEQLTVWVGQYKGYGVQIVFPHDYPAVPFAWYWEWNPPGFPHVVEGNRLCIEALLYYEKWAPDMTVETIFEALDSHWYFRDKR